MGKSIYNIDHILDAIMNVMYCIDCGRMHTTVLKDNIRHCLACLGTKLTTCPPPSMSEEEWAYLIQEEEK